MVKLFFLALIVILITDYFLIVFLRRLVYSFLLSKHNIKGAKKIHCAQSHKNKLTLNYIKVHAIYPKQFDFWHKVYLFFLVSTPLPYIVIVLVGIFNIAASVNLIIVFDVIKTICLFIVRSRFVTQYITIYDKRCNKK